MKRIRYQHPNLLYTWKPKHTSPYIQYINPDQNALPHLSYAHNRTPFHLNASFNYSPRPRQYFPPQQIINQQTHFPVQTPTNPTYLPLTILAKDPILSHPRLSLEFLLSIPTCQHLPGLVLYLHLDFLRRFHAFSVLLLLK